MTEPVVAADDGALRKFDFRTMPDVSIHSF